MGLFVVIEGADCCGKTTQVGFLCEKLVRLGFRSTAMSFPRYETRVGNAISNHLKNLTALTDMSGKRAEDDDLMFQALQTLDKYEASHDILDHLKNGYNVVSSRWWQSAVIYGADMGLNDNDELVRAHALLPRADLNVLIDVSEAESIARRPDMRDRLEKDRERQVRVRAAYRQMWANRGARSLAFSTGKVDAQGNHWLAISGSAPEERVHELIWREYLCVLQERAKRP